MRLLGSALLVSLALAVVGCGGGNDKGPSKADFIAQGDAICKTLNDGTAKVQKDLASSSAEAQKAKSLKPFAEILARAETLATQANKEFQALTPPEADKAEIDKIKKQLQTQADSFKTLAATAEKNDIPGFNKANQQVGAGQISTRAAMKKYGFKVCGATPAT